MKVESSLTRNATTAAISSPVPSLPTGVFVQHRLVPRRALVALEQLRGPDEARVQGVDPHPRGRPVQGGVLRQRADRALGGGVRRAVAEPAHGAEDRAEVDDRAASGGRDQRPEVLHAEPHAGRVDRHHRLPALDRLLLDGGEAADAGVVDQPVEPAVLPLDQARRPRPTAPRRRRRAARSGAARASRRAPRPGPGTPARRGRSAPGGRPPPRAARRSPGPARRWRRSRTTTLSAGSDSSTFVSRRS